MHHDKRLLEATGEGRIEAVDWGDVQPYVMFFTGRCGSTWLTELLAATRVVGNPREWLNSNVAKYSGALADSLPGYFSNIVEKSSSGNHFGIQVDPVRLKDTRLLVDWEAAFPAARTVTFFLYRRDLVAQAWSWVHARKSGNWHSTDPARAVANPDHTPTMRELADEMVALRRREEYLFTFWAEHGYEPRFIEYETLATDPSATVATILCDLGVPTPEMMERIGGGETKSKRLTYDDSKTRVVSEFARLNLAALTALDRDRFGVGSDFLADRLVASNLAAEAQSTR